MTEASYAFPPINFFLHTSSVKPSSIRPDFPAPGGTVGLSGGVGDAFDG